MAAVQASLLPSEIKAFIESAASQAIWLVGGAVRDRFLQRSVVDFDFVVEGDALDIARRVADRADGDYYRLDEARGAGRVLLSLGDVRYCLDFTRLAGGSLEADLRARDFTINAMAHSLNEPSKLIDPASGLQDLKDGVLRMPSPDAIQSDPIRALRAIRLAVDLDFKIEPQTYDQVKQAGPWLDRVSPERLRDELFRLLKLGRPALALRLVDHAGLLDALLPSISSLRGVKQPPPHQFDAFEHTLAVIQRLTDVLGVLGLKHDADFSADLALAEVSLRLGRFRQPLHEYLSQELSAGRTLQQLLYMAATFHDSGKLKSDSAEQDNSTSSRSSSVSKSQFLGHEVASAELAARTAARLRLSNAEIEWLQKVVLNHMRPLHLASLNQVSNRAVYHYFRQLQGAGVAIALLSLADRLGMGAAPPDEDQWKTHVDVVRALLEPYFETYDRSIQPKPLVDGNLIMQTLDIEPGPQVGAILEAVLEAQALGEISTKEEALAFARRFHREDTE